jgi:undecaprenyl-diphosphatase
VVALAFELSLVFALKGGEIAGWEVSVTRRLQSVPARDLVFDVSSTLTNSLSLPFAALFIVILGVVWFSGRRLEVALLALSFPLHVFAQFPKALIDRPRPPAGFEGIEGVGGGQSFPSGHAEYVITFYGFLLVILLTRFTGALARTAIVSSWLVFVLATGFGRIAAGRHWPVDVLASYVIGIGLLSGLVWLYSAFRAAAGDVAGGE